MAKKLKRRSKKQHHSRSRVTRLNTWTRDENTPFAETEYPFEHAISVGEYSQVLQRDLGPGVTLYPSTICLSRQDSHDSTVLTLMGEHFREFYPGEIPWLSKSAAQMYKAMMVNDEDEEDIEDFNDTLRYFADKGLLDIDLSTPGMYRYRLNVDEVRKAKNTCFKPMNTLEQINHDYPQRFPDIETQQLAFTLICGRSLYQGYILLTAWHLALRDTPWFTRHVEGKLKYLRADEIFAYLPDTIPNGEKRQQAIDQLVKKGFMRVSYQGQMREYRPNIVEMWEALAGLPQELPDIEAMGGYVDAEDNLTEPDE